MEFKHYALAATVLLAAGQTQAKLAGHNVILVHGFQPGNLTHAPADDAEIVQNGHDYWSSFWHQRADARFDWSSTERVEGETAVRLYNKAVELSQSGFCQQGCVLVTHSTGDLVTRYFLEHQEDWLSGNGYQPLNILTVIDFAGAGGGTELADAAVSVANSDSWYTYPMRAAVEAWIGGELSPERLGVLNDLQPTVARNLATTPNRIPRLRFAGAGNEYYGVTGAFITGTDDGVVPTHSSCGAVQPLAYDSCSANVTFSGKQESVSAPNAFYYNHFPVLMGENIHHGGTINDSQIDGLLTFVKNNFSAGLNVDFDTYTEEKLAWWQLWGEGDTYQYVRGSDTRTMSETVYVTLNQ